jgi:hypothetical protein
VHHFNDSDYVIMHVLEPTPTPPPAATEEEVLIACGLVTVMSMPNFLYASRQMPL